MAVRAPGRAVDETESHVTFGIRKGEGPTQGNPVKRIPCHCEERSDAAIPSQCVTEWGLLRYARNDRKIRIHGHAIDP